MTEDERDSNGENTDNEVYYNIHQAADLLTIKLPTLKKYYILFEKQTEYRFRRNQIGHIMFGSKDIEILRRLKEVKLQPKVTLEDACEIVHRDFSKPSPSILSSVDSTFIEQFLTLINEQEKLLQQQNLLIADLSEQLQEIKQETPLLIAEALKEKEKEMTKSRLITCGVWFTYEVKLVK